MLTETKNVSKAQQTPSDVLEPIEHHNAINPMAVHPSMATIKSLWTTGLAALVVMLAYGLSFVPIFGETHYFMAAPSVSVAFMAAWAVVLGALFILADSKTQCADWVHRYWFVVVAGLVLFSFAAIANVLVGSNIIWWTFNQIMIAQIAFLALIDIVMGGMFVVQLVRGGMKWPIALGLWVLLFQGVLAATYLGLCWDVLEAL